MRTRIDVTFTAGTRSIDTGITDLTIEDIRLIVNETQKKVLCSSMQKDLITSVTNGIVTYVSTNPALAQGDKITFEIDKGDDYPSAVGVLSEIASGKQAIAAAINAKGGSASATESFTELAEAVEEIPVNVQVEDAANLAFPESIAWNILKEAYAQQRVGYASWIVAEFFKEYDTIPLSGADAFYTCDGDFYTEATTHTWHDDSYNKVNRFVVYYFTGENVPFSVTQESLCPRSMAVMGKFGSINIASAGRIRQIYNGGEINDISFASTNPWCDEVLLAGVKEHNSGYILNANANVQMFASDIEVLNGGSVIYGDNSVLTTAAFPKLTEIKGGTLFDTKLCANFKKFINDSLTTIDNGYLFNSSQDGAQMQYLEEIECTGVKTVTSTGGFIRYGTDGFFNLRKIHTSLISCNYFIYYFGNGYYLNNKSCSNLIEVTIGDDFNGNCNVKGWLATNAIKDTDNSLVDEGETFANNREKFLYNFEHYIVDKLADNSTTGLSFTLTLKKGVYDVVSATQSITDKLSAKHWNLASA